MLQHKAQAVESVLTGLGACGPAEAAARGLAPVAAAMVVVLSYWLSFEYVRNPRHALEPEVAGAALVRGAFHLLSLLIPYLHAEQRTHLAALLGAYDTPLRS